MKKIFAFILSLVLITSLCACGTNTQTNSGSTTKTGIKATVVNNDGNTEQLTAKQLCDFSDANKISFEKKYWCARVTVTGKIKKIESSTTINGTHYNWTLLIDGGDGNWFIGDQRFNTSTVTEDFLASLNIGDTVEISGEIVGVSSSFKEVDISNGTISVKKK